MSASDPNLELIVARLRRGLSGMASGAPVAAAWPVGSNWPGADAAICPARLIEGGSVAHHPVGGPEPLDDRMAFVDGTQRMELLGYAGTSPIVVAEVRAAVRERLAGRLATVINERVVMAIGRTGALDAAGALLDGLERIGIEEGPPHPYRDLTEARRAVDRVRGNAELRAAERYRQGSDAWIILDGSLSGSPALAVDRRAIGIVKSHAVLPFEGADLEQYLRLPAEHRTSLFEPTPGYRPVVAWGLRLWPWEDRDLFYGLVRIEVAPAAGSAASADLISRGVLAERVPLSGGAQSDRLLYGLHTVQEYLRAEPGVGSRRQSFSMAE